MNYSEITTLALSIADRSDTETTNNMDNFLRLVEARINRKLKTMDQSANTDITITGASEYALPSDFGGLRQIKHVNGDRENPLHLATPEQLSNLRDTEGLITNPNQVRGVYYVLEDDMIKIYPALTNGNLNLTYYQSVPELTSLAPNNWVSDDDPDCYTFGLVTEIYAFVKDKESAALWDTRFKEVLEEIKVHDSESRWSGTPMQIKPA